MPEDDVEGEWEVERTLELLENQISIWDKTANDFSYEAISLKKMLREVKQEKNRKSKNSR